MVQIDLKLKLEFEGSAVTRHPYPTPQDQMDKIDHQIQDFIDAGLVRKYRPVDYPRHCTPYFLIAKPGSTALPLVVDYGEVNKKTENISGSIHNMQMENTLEGIAKCRFKTKMDKRSGFWPVDLTRATQELLVFVTSKDRVFRWKVMPLAVANAPVFFQETMNKIPNILKCRPLIQKLVSRRAEIKANIENISLGTNTREDCILLLQESPIVCQENHIRNKLVKCEFMHEKIKYLGFDVGYGWWKAAASQMQCNGSTNVEDTLIYFVSKFIVDYAFLL